jgi:UDP:flavonoid glycosyltransferase YjiC (YdhE family)
MKFVLASYGSRGDVEPTAAVGCELLRRGHEVQMAVPADLVGFVESVGLAAVPYGRDMGPWMDVHRAFWTRFFRNFWKIQDLKALWREVWEPVPAIWEDIDTTLNSLMDGADLLITGLVFEEPAANIAESRDIPLAALHYFPARSHGRLWPWLPGRLARFPMRAYEWLGWRWTKKFDDAQRSELGLPKATGPSPQRISERRSLEVQAYDEICFPGLAVEWAKWNGRRPFVGALTLELPTDSDAEVASWIAAGTPPIYFGFGSIPIQSPAETLTMISSACAELGERALVCAGWSDFSDLPHFEHVKVVGTMNFPSAFPACRALVHHGAAGTTAAGLRAGVPAVILWTWPDQSASGTQLKRLKVGTARRFSTTTEQSLVADLRVILAPGYATRARELATRMTKSAESVAAAADLVEDFARRRGVVQPATGAS